MSKQGLFGGVVKHENTGMIVLNITTFEGVLYYVFNCSGRFSWRAGVTSIWDIVQNPRMITSHICVNARSVGFCAPFKTTVKECPSIFGKICSFSNHPKIFVFFKSTALYPNSPRHKRSPHNYHQTARADRPSHLGTSRRPHGLRK